MDTAEVKAQTATDHNMDVRQAQLVTVPNKTLKTQHQHRLLFTRQ
jgi:hypothetical protein